jgi:hypothetical protein
LLATPKLKRKNNNDFFLFIESTNKNNKTLSKAMDKTNIMQLEIEEGCSRLQL